MFFVYVLRSGISDLFYVGMTENVAARIARHNSGDTKATKENRPWSLFFFESFNTKADAKKREVYLKSAEGKEFIKGR